MTVGIVGAGLAGLACAHRLRRLGFDVRLLEAAPAPGGRCEARRYEGYVVDAGAQYLLGPDAFRSTFALIREVGLEDSLVSLRPVTGQWYKGRVYHHPVASVTGLLHFRGLNFIDKALLPKMALTLSRHGGILDLEHPERGIALDDETVAQFVVREFSQNILNYIAGPLISTLFFYGSHETSRLLYLLLARHMYNTVMYTVRGGMGTLSARLAQDLDIRFETKVSEIVRRDGGFEAGGERFSHLVVAVPGDRVLGIAGLADLLDEEDVRFFQECAYQRVLSVFVATDGPVDGRCFGVSIPAVERRTASTIAFHDFMDSSRVPVDAGLLAITGGGPNVTADALLDDLQGMYPLVPRWTRIHEWPSGMPKFRPGRFRAAAAFNQRDRVPGLFFAGDYLLTPSVNGAIVSGLRAAEAIARVG